jgi:hypothetical protein
MAAKRGLGAGGKELGDQSVTASVSCHKAAGGHGPSRGLEAGEVRRYGVACER